MVAIKTSTGVYYTMPESRQNLPDERVTSFGLFEFNHRSGDLTRAGKAVRLQQRPARLLTLLIERSGHLVTREQIQEAVWSDRLVEFDQALNFAVRQIRIALGDNADSPIYIETIPKRGYRFIAPLSESAENLGVPSTSSRSALSQKALAAFVGTVALILFFSFTLRDRASIEANDGTRPLLVVLPFQNLSGDSTDDYIGIGLTEDLTTRLAQAAPERLGVIARTSAAAVGTGDLTIAEIVSELGVSYVLEGSVRITPEMTRVTAQLIDGSDQSHLWAQNFDTPQPDYLELQRDIASQVAAAIMPSMGVRFDYDSGSAPFDRADFLKGRYLLSHHTMHDTRLALPFLERAVEQAPQFADGLAALGTALMRLGRIDETRSNVQAALEIDPNHAEANRLAGDLDTYFDWDFPAAHRHYETAIAFAPNSSEARNSLAFLLAFEGELDSAALHLEQALSLDPVSTSLLADLSSVYLWAGNYSGAATHCSRTLELNPTSRTAHRCLAEAMEGLGNLDSAATLTIKLWEIRDDDSTAVSRLKNLAPSDVITESRGMELARLQAQENPPPVSVASVLLKLGRAQEALDLLETASQSRSPSFFVLGADPVFNPLRSAPRFQRIVRDLGIPRQ